MNYLRELEPQDVTFFLDYTEVEEIVHDLLGEAKDWVKVTISHDTTEDFAGATAFRPSVDIQESSMLTEEQRVQVKSAGFILGDEPFANGDFLFEKIFGTKYTILEARQDDDGAYFAIEMPFHYYQLLKEEE